MQVIAWNMEHKAASWNALERLAADIALLSEARTPKPGSVWNTLGIGRTEGRDHYPRSWSTAVVSPHGLQPIDDARPSRYGKPLKLRFETSRPGTWTAAVVSLPGADRVTAVSLYGLMDEKSDASVHRSLSELAAVFDDVRYNGLLLLGGDLNIWTGRSVAEAPHLDRQQVVLERIKAYGLIDCLEAKRPRGSLDGCPCQLGSDCSHTRTRLDPRHPDIPYQDDYLFASPELAERLTSCAVLGADEWPSPSDHFPIVASFEM